MTVSNPVLAEVLRGEIVESQHRGAIAVFDADGVALIEIGDTERPVFPRSAVKLMQALPLVESGAADAYGFGDKEMALACASHSGETKHTLLLLSMLAKAGLDEQALECGTHWPSDHEATVELAGAHRLPNQLHNNCSGKHASFLCGCRHLGIGHEGYVGFSHEWQRLLRDVMEDVTDAPHTEANHAIDGCSIPTYAVPLTALAKGFARVTTGAGFGSERAKAAQRLLYACMAEPFYVAGTGRADTALMRIAPGRIFVKGGAEGVHCAAVPELGVGIALKCDDGAGRASETVVATVLAKLFEKDDRIAGALRDFAAQSIPNRKGTRVGQIRPTDALA